MEKLHDRARVGPLEVDLAGYRASLDGRPLDLTRRELETLAFLVANLDRVHSRDEIADAIGITKGRSVDVMLSRIRRLLGKGSIRNVRGRGWILTPGGLDA